MKLRQELPVIDILETMLESLSRRDFVRVQRTSSEDRLISIKAMSAGDRMMARENLTGEQDLLLKCLESYLPTEG
jgi:hypothetical protein